MGNPYQKKFGGEWFFSDEVEDEHGPYSTQKKADQEFKMYGAYLNEGPAGLSKAFREEILRLEAELKEWKEKYEDLIDSDYGVDIC